MKKFMFLHFGFEKPTPEIMQRWNTWFESIASRQLQQGGFKGGVEISANGAHALPWDREAITGFNIIEAKSLEEAQKLAEGCPFIASIRVYELRTM